MNTSINASPTRSFLDKYVAVLKKYSDFEGRARRSDYWSFFLVNLILSQGLSLLNGLLLGGSTVVAGLLLLINLALLLPSIAVAIRRMHDVGKSGWYVLIPVYNLILACTEGTKGANEYGKDPKEKA